MSSLRRSAAKRFLALLAAILAALAGSSAALAQDDPFALPKGVTARSIVADDGPGLSEIYVDGRQKPRMVDLEWRGKTLLIDADAARAAGLPVEENVSGQITLDSLNIYEWKFDRLRQRLAITLLRHSDGKNLIDLSAAPANDGASTPLTALRIDYDLTASLAGHKGIVAGYVDTALVRGNFAAGTGIQVSTDGPNGKASAVRLDSNVQVAFPNKGIAATAGDFVSAGGQGQRALRLGGVQIASDFELRPDLVTNPLPSFSGQVAVPTGIDVISANQRLQLGEVEPGEFTVRNLPGAAGRGEVSVILRDSAGREVVQNTRFYVSRSLLAPGLSQFAANVGAVRRRYGTQSFDYGSIAASAFYRRGLSPYVTLEGSGEWTRGVGNIGARAEFIIAALAQASVETRLSSDSRVGSGKLVAVTLESAGPGFSARAGASIPSANYRDVAAKLGDPLPAKQFFAQFSFDLRKVTRMQLSVARQERRFDPRYPQQDRRTDVVDLSFRTRVRNKFEIFTSGAYRRTERGNSYSIFAGLSLQFGNGRSAYASANASHGQKTYQAGYRKFDVEPGDIGYSVDASHGSGVHRVAGSAAVRRPFGRLELQAEEVNGNVGARLNARGTLLAAGGKVFARNQTGGSYALVRTTGEVDGVTILRENRSAGATSRGGVLLVENIPSNAPVSIDVDAKKLPIDALARATFRRISVPSRAVGLVEIDVVQFRPVMRRVVDSAGDPLPAGLPVVAEPSGERTMIGYDGLVEINAAERSGRLVVGRGADRCEVDLRTAHVADEADGPPLRCVAATIAGLDGVAPHEVARRD